MKGWMNGLVNNCSCKKHYYPILVLWFNKDKLFCYVGQTKTQKACELCAILWLQMYFLKLSLQLYSHILTFRLFWNVDCFTVHTKIKVVSINGSLHHFSLFFVCSHFREVKVRNPYHCLKISQCEREFIILCIYQVNLDFSNCTSLPEWTWLDVENLTYLT